MPKRVHPLFCNVHIVTQVSKAVNGPLLTALAKAADHVDKACVETFREGHFFAITPQPSRPAPVHLAGNMLLGAIPVSGIGEPTVSKHTSTVEELDANRIDKNRAMISNLREDAQSANLLQQVTEDAKKGRMTCARPVEEADINQLVLSPRFGVEQGLSLLRA